MANHTAAQYWWRALSDDLTAKRAQQELDEFSRVRGDTRLPPHRRGKGVGGDGGRVRPVDDAAAHQDPSTRRWYRRSDTPWCTSSSTSDFRLSPVAGANDS
jgi:hypothetical protein